MNQWNKKSVLITGAGGFIGNALTYDLLKNKAYVTVLVKNKNDFKNLNVNINKNTNIIEGNIEDTEKVYSILKNNNISMVYHLAASNFNLEYKESPIEIFETNIRGTWSILEACRLYNKMKIIILASSKEAHFGELFSINKTQKEILKPYQISKIATELVAKTYADNFNMPIIITRFDNVYGGGDKNWNRLIPSVIKSILSNHTIELRSNGKQLRSYIYIDDLVNNLKELAILSNKFKTNGQIYEFSENKVISALEIIEIICKISNKNQLEYKINEENENERIYNTKNKIKWEKYKSNNKKTKIYDGLVKTYYWYENYFKGYKV